MRKSFYLLLFCLSFSFACDVNHDPSIACGVRDPIENIAWLRQWAEESANHSDAEYSYIKQANYKGERVFFWGSCNPASLWALVLRDCSGNPIEGEYTFDDLKNQVVIWQPENAPCNV
ncbi:hypothetical protein J2X69_000076 [Algoriphagus sp. 4150]|uniref:hypothetical protein n=1 Tax=Algoriphagus sp. 4150 TaxID=2817756 RepID=UPI00285CF881|nr:hypothetical protein [Algoriphagus sp. 4150]MDR7127748.1 hypothetical protein [Algoriphagus sp. 4150]